MTVVRDCLVFRIVRQSRNTLDQLFQISPFGSRVGTGVVNGGISLLLHGFQRGCYNNFFQM